VFKVAAFGLYASMKTSSPLLNCRVNHSLVKVSHADTMQIGQWKSFLSKLCVVWSEWQTA